MPNLTIYLLREEITTAASAIEKLANEHEISKAGVKFGTLYVEKIPLKNPKWVDLFFGLTDTSLFDQVRTSSALYVTEAGGRLFALAFGQGRHMLKPGAFEDRFGLKVVINTLKSDQLRSVDKRTFDTVDQNVRSQVSQRSAATEFGIDIEKDLIRGITGQPSDPHDGSRMTGADSLVVAVDVTVPALTSLLERYLNAFNSESYKDGFAWIDQIHQINDNSPTKKKLEDKLVEKMTSAKDNQGHEPDLWLTIPDVVDYAGIYRFRFTGSTNSHNDLHLPGFVRALRDDEAITLDLLKRKYAYAVDEDGHEVGDKWPVYKCIHLELEEGNQKYLLAAGKWFSISKSFTDEVDAFFDSVPRKDLGWLHYKHKSEGDYNQAVSAGSDGKYALMDAVQIDVGGLRDKMEFCDLYSLGLELIHVKRYGASSLLGHLFNQGLVSGEHLRSDEKFLLEVNGHLPQSHKLQIEDNVPRDVTDFKIVFAIISEDQSAALHIPFFAKVAFKHVCLRLRSFGFTHIFVSKILVDDVFRKTEKIKNRKSKKTRNN